MPTSSGVGLVVGDASVGVGDGEADVLGDGVPVTDGVGVGDGESVTGGVGEGDADGVGDAEADGDGEPVTDGVGDGNGDPVTDGVGAADALAVERGAVVGSEDVAPVGFADGNVTLPDACGVGVALGTRDVSCALARVPLTCWPGAAALPAIARIAARTTALPARESVRELDGLLAATAAGGRAR